MRARQVLCRDRRKPWRSSSLSSRILPIVVSESCCGIRKCMRKSKRNLTCVTTILPMNGTSRLWAYRSFPPAARGHVNFDTRLQSAPLLEGNHPSITGQL